MDYLHSHFGQREGECQCPTDCDCRIGRTEPMLTDAEIAFLKARLDEDEAVAKAAADDGRFAGRPHWSALGGGIMADAEDPDWCVADLSPCIEDERVAVHFARHDPARALRDVALWRRLILEYRTAPLDSTYGDIERETGFRLALSTALKAKIATYEDNPVTGEPFP